MFKGTYPAIATPFRRGKLDLPALTELVGHLVTGGIEGIVACGTTGESPTLATEEWEQVVSTCVSAAPGLPVIAGAGTNDTAATIRKCRRAAELGAAAALVVTPYYNRPTPAGLVAHFRAVAAEGGLPIILYNVPSRTGVNLAPETVRELALVDGIVGIKDATGSVDRFTAILQEPVPGFALLSGDDSLSYPLYALGGHGVISTTAVAAPGPMATMYHLAAAGRWEEARQLHFRLAPLFSALFVESNPGPLKYALSLLGWATNELRLPLVPVKPESERTIRKAMVAAGLIEER